jgi:hypothetical protein
MDEAERWERMARELVALNDHVYALGLASGIRAWVEESVGIGLMFEGESADYVWRMYEYTHASMKRHLERRRAEHPTWGAAFGWHADMTDEELLAFEWGLLTRLPELWA